MPGPTSLPAMAEWLPQPPGKPKQGQAMSKLDLLKEFFSESSQRGTTSRRSFHREVQEFRTSDISTQRTSCGPESWSNPPWVKEKPAAIIQVGRQCGDTSYVDVQVELRSKNPGGIVLIMIQALQLKEIKGFHQTQFLGGHQSGGRSATSVITTASEKGPREGMKIKSSTACWDVRTLCKAPCTVNERCLQADSKTYVYILQECITMKCLAEGKKVHAHIIQSGFKPNVLVLNTLVNMYAKCGSLVDARHVFDEMPKRDIFTWNIIIGGYAKRGYGREALKLYKQMQWDGVAPNRVTFICVLNGCASLGALDKGTEVHADINKSGITPDIILDNTLIHMYARCGDVKFARQVFDSMAQQDVVSWNAMIVGYAKHGCGREALQIYEQMQQEGLTPNTVTFLCILNACTSLRALKKGKEVHADIIKAGIKLDVILETALADMYAKCGSMKDAQVVFDNILERNVVSWSAMIAGYAQHGSGRDALDIYQQMQQAGVMPNRVTFVCVLKACASLGALEKGKEVHADINRSGIAPDIILENALINMYAKCGSVKDAHQVFDSMAQQDVVSWSALITGYAQHGYGGEALEIYRRMQQEHVMPNRVTFISVLKACASLGTLEKGKEVHAEIIKARIAPDIILETALADMYAKCGSTNDERKVFDNMAWVFEKMTQQNVGSWNAMIDIIAQYGCGREALSIYEKMQREGVTPDRVTFICVLNACANLGALEKGKEVHADVIKAGIESYINLENALVNMYAKCGSVKDACEVFTNMDQRNLVSWNGMIAGFGQHGYGAEALQLYEQMQQHGLKPDGITFISLLSACSHAGLVDEGSHYFNSMSQAYGLTPSVEHFGCMVDLLGRAGQLDEAKDLISKMPMEPDASVWGALLGACRVHGNVV